MNSKFSPVALFVYNRADNTQKTLRALMANTLAPETELYVFSDGGKDEASWAAVREVRTLLHEVEEEVARLESLIKEAQERQKELKQGLYDLMAKHDVKSFTGSRVKLTRVLPTESTSFDSKEFKVDHPDIYKEYCKKTQKAGSLRITLI